MKSAPFGFRSSLHPHLPKLRARRRRTSGVALVLVLAIMVLVMGLVVGMLGRVSTERSAADGYANSVQARLLGDTAVQVVQAQISQATMPPAGTRSLWTSQPGLIRTFDESGSPSASFKLYSSTQMRLNSALVPEDEALTLASWFSSPAVFTDLNVPVDSNFDGTPDTWPILDSSSLGTPAAPQGFDILTTAPRGTSQGYINPAPMPVRWLYVLKDGQLVAADGSGNVATVNGAAASNPIVGRIAFWTDDESCKVNVNTAGEGTYWDIPRADTTQERDLGRYQPTKNEFQIYPGHPATTSISAVFPALFPTTPTPPETTGAVRERLFAMLPRLRNIGTKGATVPIHLIDKTSLSLDQDRLYASEPELLFGPAITSGERSVNTGLTHDLLEQTKFFLTATSRAPETNPFDHPKIACWPIHTNPAAGTHRSAFDQLIAFCGNVQGQPWYFQRQNANSPTDDYLLIPRNQQLYSYLQTLINRPVPGFGGRLSTRFVQDADQILTQIFDYIRCSVLEDMNLTGTTGQFGVGIPSLPADNRTRLNYGHVMPIKIGNTRGFGRTMTISQAGLWFIATGDPGVAVSNDPATNRTLALATPLQQDATTKEIRIETAFLFEPFCASAGWASFRPDVVITIEGLESWTVQGNGGVPDAINLGFPALSRQTATDAGLFVHGRQPSFVNKSLNWSPWMGLRWMLDYHVVRARNGGRLPQDPNFNDSSDGGTGYQRPGRQNPFVGEPITVRVSKTNPRITCSPATLTFRMTNRQTGDLIQKITWNFPGGTFPAPVLFTSGSGGAVAPIDPAWWTFQAAGCGIPFTDTTTKNAGRLNSGETNYGIYCYRFMKMDHDTVRALTPAKNGETLDLRLLAALEDVPGDMWTKHFDYDELATNTRHRLACSFVEPNASLNTHPVYNYNKGKYANMTGNYSSADAPPIPYPAPAAQATGDWENGLAGDMDAPTINKPDEGNAYTQGTNLTPYFNSNTNQRTFTADFSSPNRVMPSPGMLGSLPTGVKRGLGWQTLLFRRQPGHPSYPAGAGGFINNPDYLLMDYFWMPVVEPYAISEPLSTAGKINLNQQIIPFTYIKRETGMYALLKNEKVTSIPAAALATYKAGAGTNYSFRRPINIPATLAQLGFRFDNTDATGLYAFRTPSEICDMHFVPDTATTVNTTTKATMDTTMAAHWQANSLTGDGTRERIYTTVYPRVTTRSNVYTVYFRAQALKPRPRLAAADENKWYEGQDVITGDYRGSTTLERYVDLNTPGIPDYAANPDATPTLGSFYRWRVRVNRPFAP
ncbi:hypothetical protein DB346_06675 [Verrucomicrobia bacterium LW23]|nr:hypothetical protein DB346_06675 [Verrucomicrobia bacterium LW23]